MQIDTPVVSASISQKTKKEKPVNEFEQKLAEDKAKKEKVQPTNVQNASSQFDDLFNN